MSAKPWLLSTLILALLTFADWSGLRINISFGRFLNSPSSSQAVVSNQPANSAVNSATNSAQVAQTPFVAPAKIDYVKELKIPGYEKTSAVKTTITDLLQSDAAIKVKDQLIPKEGTKTGYGLEIGLKTYEVQKKWDKEITLEGGSLDRAQRLIDETYHPCCGASINAKVCGCGHAVGLRGLIKKMVQEGKSDEEIKKESFVWLRYFFPKHYVIMGLYMQKIGRDLSEINHTQVYSSIDAQRPVTDYLIRI